MYVNLAGDATVFVILSMRVAIINHWPRCCWCPGSGISTRCCLTVVIPTLDTCQSVRLPIEIQLVGTPNQDMFVGTSLGGRHFLFPSTTTSKYVYDEVDVCLSVCVPVAWEPSVFGDTLWYPVTWLRLP